MKKHLSNRKTGWVVVLAVMATLIQVRAADMAGASGVLAEVSVMAVQAKAGLASAANSGDVKAISDAVNRADAVDAAVADARSAYAAMERAAAGGDEDAAAASADALEAARQAASDALNGVVPEAVQKTAQEIWKESTTNTGGGPGSAYDAPNIYDVPWQTQGMRSLYTALFGSFWSASGQTSPGDDYDATPE